jgi:archaellin
MPSKRKGISPVATIIIYVVLIVTAAIVAYFFYSSTARSTRTPILTVVGQPTVYANGSLYVTFKNDGTSPVTMTGATIIVQDVNKNPVQFNYVSGPATLNPGSSASYKFNTVDARFDLDNIPDGALATLQTTDGYQLSFAVAKP